MSLKLPPEPRQRCESCGAALADGQEWCLQCGSGAPGSVAKERDWRPLAVLAAVGAVVLAGAATAAALALNQQPVKPPTHLVIAQVTPPPPSTTPGASTLNTTPATPTPGSSGAGKTGGAFGTGGGTSGLPSSAVRPPKLPSVVPTPRVSPAISQPSTNAGSTPTTPTTPSSSSTNNSTTGQPQTPNPILLDTDAASTYNPSGYPASYFGDPSLAVDGEAGTAWTAQVEPASAPRMAAGLALDMKTATHVGSLEVLTSSVGTTVEVFGANGATLPPAITDPAWTRLTPAHVMKKKTATIRLGTGGKAYRYLVLWLVKAPASAIGTSTAPGHVSIGEVVPYAPLK